MIGVSVCRSVCSFENHLSSNYEIFLCYLTSVAVARSSSGDIRYAHPVLWITSCFHMMGPMQRNQTADVMCRRVRLVAAPEVKSAILDCLYRDGISIAAVKGIGLTRCQAIISQ